MNDTEELTHRRITACVKAFNGVPLEDIEEMAGTPNGVMKLVVIAGTLLENREAAISALLEIKGLACVAENWATSDHTHFNRGQIAGRCDRALLEIHGEKSNPVEAQKTDIVDDKE